MARYATGDGRPGPAFRACLRADARALDGPPGRLRPQDCRARGAREPAQDPAPGRLTDERSRLRFRDRLLHLRLDADHVDPPTAEIGSASRRESVCQSRYITAVTESVKKKTH